MRKIKFIDYPEFTPNLTPKQMFSYGIMGGWYFRTIKSPNTNITYKNHHKLFPFLNNISLNKLNNQEYDANINKYKVKVGSSYEFWMQKKWINEKIDPYGWIEWYCNFYSGRRTYDDKRQIDRWKNIAGERGRFKMQLQNKLKSIHSSDRQNKFPKLRQILLHWGYDSSKL
jgi:hypothetical protein